VLEYQTQEAIQKPPGDRLISKSLTVNLQTLTVECTVYFLISEDKRDEMSGQDSEEILE
jgi:hypothetical protein